MQNFSYLFSFFFESLKKIIATHYTYLLTTRESLDNGTGMIFDNCTTLHVRYPRERDTVLLIILYSCNVFLPTNIESDIVTYLEQKNKGNDVIQKVAFIYILSMIIANRNKFMENSNARIHPALANNNYCDFYFFQLRKYLFIAQGDFTNFLFIF